MYKDNLLTQLIVSFNFNEIITLTSTKKLYLTTMNHVQFVKIYQSFEKQILVNTNIIYI